MELSVNSHAVFKMRELLAGDEMSITTTTPIACPASLLFLSSAQYNKFKKNPQEFKNVESSLENSIIPLNYYPTASEVREPVLFLAKNTVL